jgi:hypothetical protein
MEVHIHHGPNGVQKGRYVFVISYVSHVMGGRREENVAVVVSLLVI